MTEATRKSITELLVAWSDGDRAALDELVPLVHSELRRIARNYMRGERKGHTLQTTALINEAYVRLVDQKHVRWQNRAHFLAIASELMRRILVDYARRRLYQKRGAGALQVTLGDAETIPVERTPDLVALDDALKTLAELNTRQAQIVELRYFGGLTEGEVAEVLKTSERTVRRDWSLARAWLYRELSKND